MKIEIITFIPGDGKPSERLLRVVDTLNARYRIHVRKTIQDLLGCLKEKSGSISVILVLLAADIEALNGLVSLKQFLNFKRLILILPDKNEETLRLGFSLFPRYISYINQDFKDVSAVIKQMILNIDRGHETYLEKAKELKVKFNFNANQKRSTK